MNNDYRNLKIIWAIIYFELLNYYKRNTDIKKSRRFNNDDNDVISRKLGEDIHSQILDDELWSQYISGLYHTWFTLLITSLKSL